MRGVIYVAYGDPAKHCLAHSVASLREAHPKVPLRVVSDEPIGGIPTQIAQASDIGARSIKTRLPDFVPKGWSQVLYLDVDTHVLKALDRFWRPLDNGWDMVVCRDETAATVRSCRLRHRKEIKDTIVMLGTPHVVQFSGGAMSWNVNKYTRRFFVAWHREWAKYGRRDQGALTRALATVPLKLYPLEYAANAKFRVEAIEIWHEHGAARRRGSP